MEIMSLKAGYGKELHPGPIRASRLKEKEDTL